MRGFYAGITAIIFAWSSSVFATVVTFDDIALPASSTTAGGTGSGTIPANYNGLTFAGFGVVNPQTYVPTYVFPPGVPVPPSLPQGFVLANSGYAAGTVSPSQVAGSIAVPAGSPFVVPVMISAAEAFTLTSGAFTAAWNDDLVLRIVGTQGGASIFTQSYILSATTPTVIDFGDVVVDTLSFSASGGTKHAAYTDGQGLNFALDNLSFRFASAVPEPSSWAMMIVGFGLAAAMMRRRCVAACFVRRIGSV